MPVNGEKINDNKEARLEKKCKSHNLMMKYEEREREIMWKRFTQKGYGWLI